MGRKKLGHMYHRWNRKSKFPLVLCLLSAMVYAAPVGRKDASELPVPPLAGDCRIAINEISLQDLDEQFIELTKICKDPSKSTKAISMQKYALVFVNSNDYIIGTCLLKGNIEANDPWFYTIGSDSLSNVHFKLSDCTMDIDLAHQLKDKFPGDMRKTPVFGVLLVRKESTTPFLQYKLVNLGMAKRKKKLAKQIKGTMITGIQDFYIITTDKRKAITQELMSLYSQYTTEDQLEVKTDDLQHKYSFSRCVYRSELALPKRYQPMQPTLFRKSKPTPGALNDCTETTMAIQRSSQQGTPVFDFENFPTDASAAVSYASAQPIQVVQHTLPQSATETISVSATPTIEPTVIANEAESEYASPFRYDVKPLDTFMTDFGSETSFFWEDCSPFPNDQLTALQDLRFRPIDVQKLVTFPTCTWVEYIIPRKLIVCKLCRKLLSQNIIFDRPGLLPDIIKNGAGLFDVKTEDRGYTATRLNHQMLKDHESSMLHRLSVEFLTIYKSGLRDQALMDAFQGPNKLLWEFLLPTMNLVVSVIQGIKLGISFNTYSVLMETLDYFKAETGHLYRNPKGMKTVADLIGLTLHKNIVERWLTERPELSITLDTTTDISGYGILAILFHTVENSGDLKIYLYRMLHIPKGESGYNLFDQFLQALKDDGIDQWVKEKCVGLTTDGAKAVKIVFRNLLNGFCNNEIVGVWCGAHKLERATEKAFAEHEYLTEMDEFINSVYRMLSKKSPLRREEFRQQIPNFLVRTFEFSRVRELRWLPFHVHALAPYIKRLNVLHATLYAIVTNPKVQLKTRREAEVLLNQLKDATFLATIAFAGDVLSVIADESIQYQRHAGTLIGKRNLRKKTENKLIALQTSSGEHIEYLLTHAKYPDGPETSNADRSLKNRIEKFETTALEYLDVKLNPPHNMFTAHRVYTKMQNYVDSLLTQLDAYYPSDLLDNYDVFAPELLPTSIEDIGDYGQTELRRLNIGYKWKLDEQILLAEWKTLLSSLISQSTYSSMISKYPEEFWQFYLKSEQVDWKSNIRSVVSKALTIPSSSAGCERTFSIYRFIKSYRRYSLLPATVENLIRIKMNGVKDLKDWDVMKFAKAFIVKNHSRSDDNSRYKNVKSVCQQENPLLTTSTAEIETCPAFEEEMRVNDYSFPIIDVVD